MSSLFNKAKGYISGVMNYKQNIPPNVKKALEQIGNDQITSARCGRTPVQSVVQGALRTLADVPFDNLFHLFLEMTLSNGEKWIIEKIERITIVKEDRSNKQGAEFTQSFSVNKTVNELFQNTENFMGNRFLPYQSNSNNCQVFIMGILDSNGLNNPQLTEFVKQDTRSIFKNNPYLRKFANTMTDLGGYFNAAFQGGSIKFRTNELSNVDIDHIMNHYKIPYHGCYIKNRLPKHLSNGAYVINLNGHSHWTALVKDGNKVFYFDSFGFPPPMEVEERVGDFTWSDKDIQAMSSSSCGWYCVSFIKFLYKKKDKEKAFKDYLKLFSKHLLENETILGGLL